MSFVSYFRGASAEGENNNSGARQHIVGFPAHPHTTGWSGAFCHITALVFIPHHDSADGFHPSLWSFPQSFWFFGVGCFVAIVPGPACLLRVFCVSPPFLLPHARVFVPRRLALYVYEYLLHIGAQKSAQTFLSEVCGIWGEVPLSK